MNNASHRDSTQSQRVAALDVLRGIAVLAVIAQHTGYNVAGHDVPFFDRVLYPVLCHCYLGVQLFFAISGYCIMGAVESADRGPTPLVSFVHRRIRRIYPTYWLSLILVIALGCGTVGITRNPWRDIFPLTTTDWLLNVLLLQRLFGAPDALLPYWSLSIEVQFYGVMAICLAAPRWRSAWLVGLSCSYALWAWQMPFSISGTALAHWPDFACGIAAYAAQHPLKFWRGMHWQLWGLSAVAIAFGLNTQSSLLLEKGDFILPVKQMFCLAFGLILCLFQQFSPRTPQNAILRFLAWVGTISYSLYLTHFPVMTRVFNLAGRIIPVQGINCCAVIVLATALQFTVGWLFFRLCEQRWLNSARGQSHAPRVSAIGSSAVVT